MFQEIVKAFCKDTWPGWGMEEDQDVAGNEVTSTAEVVEDTNSAHHALASQQDQANATSDSLLPDCLSLVVPLSYTSSTDSTVCRICQLTEKESGKFIITVFIFI